MTIMKKLFTILSFLSLLGFSASAQSVTEYTYKLDDGITVRTERCWNHVWVQQDFSALKAGDLLPLSVSTRTLGDLTSGSSFKLLDKGKEVKMKGVAPGKYDLKLTFKLSGKPGTLSFVVPNVEIKAKTKTTVNVTLYDYQISITETKNAALKGLSTVDSRINRFKGNEDVTNTATPTFYMKGSHDKAVPPVEAVNKSTEKIKAGTYDVLVSVGASGQVQKIWLENFNLKPDMSYVVSTNLNGGVILYSGINRDIKKLHLYPAGTADRQTGAPAPVKNLEIGNFETVTSPNACPPGAYDVLLAMGNKYEWRKNLVIKTGSRTEVK